MDRTAQTIDSALQIQYIASMLKFLKMLLGIALLPFAWALSAAVYELYRTSAGSSPVNEWEAWALPTGFILWVLLFFLLPRPFRTYVLGHELTHALWAILMGGRVGRIKVGKTGGHVELSRTNFVITLAPYFFPFYTALAIGAYYLCGIWFEVETHRAWWLALIGLTWSFHLTFTMHMLSQHQPDVQEHGRIFSYIVIYIMNVFVIGIWMILIGSPKIAVLGNLLGHETTLAYQTVSGWLTDGWQYCVQQTDRSAEL